MKKLIFSFLLLLFIFISNTPASYASTILEDSFQGGINPNYWELGNYPNAGYFFALSQFGIKDISNQGFYTFLDTKNISYQNNNEVKLDVNINNNDPSAFSIICRKDSDNLFGAQFYPTGNGNTLDRINSWDFINYTWDNSNGIHHFDVVCNGQNITVKEDGNTLYDDPNHLYQTFTGTTVEFTFGDGHSSEFANFQLCDINGCAPATLSLPVPLLKQTDPLWTNFTYDSADLWAPYNPTIGNWGCAITSAAMVMKYYHIDKLPGQGNTDLTPETLDAWLNTQPDGYIYDGWVNWLALARLSHEAKSNNPNFAYDALEFNRVRGADTTTLLADLTNNQPDILEEPGHFIVAIGQDSNNAFTINDPYYSRSTLTDYGSTFSSLNRFIPSHTNLSYMLFTAPSDLTITLKDSSGNPVGENYIQQLLHGAQSNTSSGNPFEVLSFQKPPAGTYTLTVSGNMNEVYTLKGFFYDQNGNVQPFTLTGVIDPNNPNTLTLHFDPQNLTNDTQRKIVMIQTFLSDLQDLYSLKEVKFIPYQTLHALGMAVKNSLGKNTIASKTELALIAKFLKTYQDKGVDATSYQILSSDVQYLQNHL